MPKPVSALTPTTYLPIWGLASAASRSSLLALRNIDPAVPPVAPQLGHEAGRQAVAAAGGEVRLDVLQLAHARNHCADVLALLATSFRLFTAAVKSEANLSDEGRGLWFAWGISRQAELGQGVFKLGKRRRGRSASVRLTTEESLFVRGGWMASASDAVVDQSFLGSASCRAISATIFGRNSASTLSTILAIAVGSEAEAAEGAASGVAVASGPATDGPNSAS